MRAAARTRFRLWVLVLMPMLACGAPAGANGNDAVDLALQRAAHDGRAVLVEFRAPWCYSCYYMATHVHRGAQWQALQRRVVLLELDADSPEGAARMAAWQVKALPAYLVLDATGAERGRVLGEQTREDFHAAIGRLLDVDDGLEALQARAAQGRASVTELVGVLEGFVQRGEGGAGLDWIAGLAPAVRAQADHPDLRPTLARLRLMRAADEVDGAACLEQGSAVLDARPGCERPYLLRRALACADADPKTDPEALARWQRAQTGALEKLVDTRILPQPDPSPAPAPACADRRSAVLVLAELHRRNGSPDARQALLRRAADHYRAGIGEGPGADRSVADNLRVVLEALDDHQAYQALMTRLIAQWPDDYVYPYRYGRYRLEHGEPLAALPLLERAAGLAYGENRLRVAELRVRALVALHRTDEARRVAAQALRLNGPWFPERVAVIRSVLEAGATDRAAD